MSVHVGLVRRIGKAAMEEFVEQFRLRDRGDETWYHRQAGERGDAVGDCWVAGVDRCKCRDFVHTECFAGLPDGSRVDHVCGLDDLVIGRGAGEGAGMEDLSFVVKV